MSAVGMPSGNGMDSWENHKRGYGEYEPIHTYLDRLFYLTQRNRTIILAYRWPEGLFFNTLSTS